MENLLKIYKSSAGSGKTFTLVKEYLHIVLAKPEEYRHILAITFTNKAAQEMKSRVIESLVSLSSGEPSDMRSQLETGLSGIPITERAAKVLTLILHDYPSFSISTIDSFFQKLLRALAREIHLPLRVEIQLQTDDAVLDVVDRLLNKAGNDPELSKWIKRLILKKLDEDKGWNLEKDIEWIAKEMLKERGTAYQPLSRDDIHVIAEEIRKQTSSFKARMKKIGEDALKKMAETGYAFTDFSYGKSSIANYFNKISNPSGPSDFEMGARTLNGLAGVDGWIPKAGRKDTAKLELVEQHLIPALQAAADLMESEFNRYLTGTEVDRTLYLFGIINDLTALFAEYRKENNQLLISDTPKLLQEIITGDDTPFIYEKTGNRYKYLLIDEFQDTSDVQWKNLLPLVLNSLGSGFMTLIVGDAKQSIYRWRGGEVKLLLNEVQKDLNAFHPIIREHSLDVNYRSKKEIIQFNNDLFTVIPTTLATIEELEDLSLLHEAYGNGLVQKIAGKNNSGGYVEWRTISGEAGDDDTFEPEISAAEDASDKQENKKSVWKVRSMDRALKTIQDAVLRGFRYRDIAILVRNNKEGNMIADHLFRNGIEKIITPDSLAISGSPKVRFLINAFRLLANPTNDIARSQLLHYYTLAKNLRNIPLHDVFHHPKQRKNKTSGQGTLIETDTVLLNTFNRVMPPAFVESMPSLAKLPVYEISEQLVQVFEFDKEPDAYVQRLQDLVLEFNAKHHASVTGFIDWWDNNERIRMSSVIIPENEDAIRIMSIHKSKGLQFPIVLMPFVDWKLMPKSGGLIWVHSEQAPFDRLGQIGVYSSPKLNKTFFNADWQQEISATVVDNVNLLYVAFTRAEEELYLYGPEDKGGDLGSCNKLVLRSLATLGHSVDADGVIAIGEKTLQPKIKNDATRSDVLPSYPAHRWQDKISIVTRARRLSDLLKEKKDDKIKYGILVHAVIADIKTNVDIDTAIERVRFDGMIGEKEKADLKSSIVELINHPQLREFFDESWEIRREREILTPSGSTLRPDRVLTKNSDAVILDFKTGKQHASHHEQLIEYSDLLVNMGYKSVRKYLVYLNGPEVVEVNENGVANERSAS